MLKFILLFFLVLPYIIFVFMYRKVSFGEWSGFFFITLLWYLLWLTVIKDIAILSTIANIGAYFGIILGGVFALIGAIKQQKLLKRKE